MKNKICRTD